MDYGKGKIWDIVYNEKGFMEKVNSLLVYSKDNPEEIDSISKDLGVKPEEVREMEKRLSGQDLAFDPLTDSDDDEAAYSPSHYLQDESSNPEEIFEKESINEENTSTLHNAINELDDRSRDILQDRWLANKKLTLL